MSVKSKQSRLEHNQALCSLIVANRSLPKSVEMLCYTFANSQDLFALDQVSKGVQAMLADFVKSARELPDIYEYEDSDQQNRLQKLYKNARQLHTLPNSRLRFHAIENEHDLQMLKQNSQTLRSLHIDSHDWGCKALIIAPKIPELKELSLVLGRRKESRLLFATKIQELINTSPKLESVNIDDDLNDPTTCIMSTVIMSSGLCIFFS
jgi:hypothetical protein